MKEKFKKELLELFECGGTNGGLFISEDDQNMLYEELLKLVKANSVLGDVRNTYQDGYRVGYLEATIEACKSILKK